MREWEACSALTKRKLQHLILDKQSGRICLSAFPDSESVFVFPPLPSMALRGPRWRTAPLGAALVGFLSTV